MTYDYKSRKCDIPNSKEFCAGYRQGLYYAYKRFDHHADAKEVLKNAILREDNWAILIADTKNTSIRRSYKRDEDAVHDT